MLSCHKFTIISHMESVSDSHTKKVSISDDLILYMNDSFEWIDSLWNGTKKNTGLNYYGETVIRDENLVKFRNIVHAWIQLFECATEKFILQGLYSLSENTYEKNVFQKEDVLQQLKALCSIWEIAIQHNDSILHSGI